MIALSRRGFLGASAAAAASLILPARARAQSARMSLTATTRTLDIRGRAATVWGLIWHPYRALEGLGLAPVLGAALTYGVALLLGLPLLRRRLGGFRPSRMLFAIALAAGGCNLGYVLATVHGEVMRVLLLFYLAPLWTVLLAFLLLDEKVGLPGTAVIGLSLAGAFVMLWQPSRGLPLPQNGAEWLGLAAGCLFALANVLIRKAQNLSIEAKSLAVFAGVVAVGLMALPIEPAPILMPPPQAWLLVALVGIMFMPSMKLSFDDRFYIDGETRASLRGTGTEDYFLCAWGFEKCTFPDFGVPWLSGEGMGQVGDMATMYRWHLSDPIRFGKSLRATLEHTGWMDADETTTGKVEGHVERGDDFASVAFWYQRGQPKRFTQIPPLKDRRADVPAAGTGVRLHAEAAKLATAAGIRRITVSIDIDAENKQIRKCICAHLSACVVFMNLFPSPPTVPSSQRWRAAPTYQQV